MHIQIPQEILHKQTWLLLATETNILCRQGDGQDGDRKTSYSDKILHHTCLSLPARMPCHCITFAEGLHCARQLPPTIKRLSGSDWLQSPHPCSFKMLCKLCISHVQAYTLLVHAPWKELHGENCCEDGSPHASSGRQRASGQSKKRPGITSLRYVEAMAGSVVVV